MEKKTATEVSMEQQENPRRQEITALRNEANTLLFDAESIAQIKSVEDEARATEFLVRIKKSAKLVEAKRKGYTDPLRAVITQINTDFGYITQPLEDAERIVKKGMTAFRDAEEFKAKEAARKAAEIEARRAAESLVNTDAPNAMERVQEAGKALAEAKQEAPKTVTTASGGANFRKDWKFEITDRAAIEAIIAPDVLNIAFHEGIFDKVIRQRIKMGARNIPGVKMWEETVPIIRGA